MPISSTGHMILLDEFLQLDMTPEFMEMFYVVIQLGAILAVLILFWSKLCPVSFHGKPHLKKDVLALWPKIIVAYFLPELSTAKNNTNPFSEFVLFTNGGDGGI